MVGGSVRAKAEGARLQLDAIELRAVLMELLVVGACGAVDEARKVDCGPRLEAKPSKDLGRYIGNRRLEYYRISIALTKRPMRTRHVGQV